FFQAEAGIRDFHVTGVQTCALPIYGDQFQAGTLGDCRNNLVVRCPIIVARFWLDLLPEQRLAHPVKSSVFDPRQLARQSLVVIRSEERRVGKERGSQSAKILE